MYIGIDGCRAGWVVATIDDQHQLFLRLINGLQQLQGNTATVAYIDIPLGFAEGHYRTCELKARHLLGPQKGASVFLTPHRAAVYAHSFTEANQINRLRMGKGVSIQAWNICTKIKEAVAFSAQGNGLQLQEAHPELCFYFLNEGKPLLTKKSSRQGIAERLQIIASVSDEYGRIIEEMMAYTKRKELKMDDILDATVLAIRAASTNPQMVLTADTAPACGNIFF